MIRIYDTMAREKRPFVPREEGKVGMYVCGPTVAMRVRLFLLTLFVVILCGVALKLRLFKILPTWTTRLSTSRLKKVVVQLK